MPTSATVVIAGGGLTGCLTGLVLQRKFPQARIVILDQQSGEPRQDPRGLALALRTQEVLAEYGVWRDELANSPAIRNIHVSDANSPGTMTMHAARVKLPALGYVAMAGLLQKQLTAACQRQVIEHRFDVTITALKAQAHGYLLQLSTGEELHADLLVVAEGGNSSTRNLLGVAMQQFAYEQVAVAAHVTFAKQHQGWAYERFTSTGPVALLPQGRDQAALVWCMTAEQAQQLHSATETERLRQVQRVFGAAPGRIQDLQLQATFPLQLALAERVVGHRHVILGNAAHTLHPVAGQGYNLAVRDILDLAESLHEQDFASIGQLSHYEARRQHDYQEIITLTHGLVTVFSNTDTLWRNVRSKGLYLMRTCNLLSRPLMRKAMGFRSLI
ncbi:FAD-dependent monooxygenase [Aliidiomarina haloalkalitolerans]|uniref:FAD-binding domain-containing protein n=1 Tax=Aliidiomarina haloalkalitolerans TaxID=859059 RepID=A0A432VTW9_9GAMM|nr:FAD-dependent monooxygenase [Aliidiomarina haloalkalitolerans]RUO19883.1 hypothetical protein CWE06_07565 [Aliidiomarina haloalkalitolerans]